jgi:hypothetical protein
MRAAESRRLDPGYRNFLILSICWFLVVPLWLLAQTTVRSKGRSPIRAAERRPE